MVTPPAGIEQYNYRIRIRLITTWAYLLRWDEYTVVMARGWRFCSKHCYPRCQRDVSKSPSRRGRYIHRVSNLKIKAEEDRRWCACQGTGNIEEVALGSSMAPTYLNMCQENSRACLGSRLRTELRWHEKQLRSECPNSWCEWRRILRCAT
jgi:hypothetical protein